MRKRILAQRTVFDHAFDLLIEMFKPSKKLRKMNAILDANPHIVAAVHADLTEHSTDSWKWGTGINK